MWRPEFVRRQPQPILRVGRQRLELWLREGPAIRSVAQQPLASVAGVSLSALEEALQVLLQAQAQFVKGQPVETVLESAWLPILGLPAADSLWSSAPLQALLKHRVHALYGAHWPVGSTGWELRVDHQPGAAVDLGFALPKAVRAALVAAIAAAGGKLAGLEPALAWGARQQRWTSGWWCWCEQDRTLMLKLEKGQVRALQPAGPVASLGMDWEAVADVEAVREGVEVSVKHPVMLAGWPDRPAAKESQAKS